MNRIALIVALSAAVPLARAAAAPAIPQVRTGTEWRYTGEVRRTVAEDAPKVQRLTAWATVVGQAVGRPEVVRYRHLRESDPVFMGSAVWQTAGGAENGVLPRELRSSPEVRMMDSLLLPAPFSSRLKPGESTIVRVPLFGYPLPFPQTLPVRRRVVGEESVDGRTCLKVERSLVAPLPLTANGIGLLVYREQLWVERGGGALVRFEGTVRTQLSGETKETTLATTLRLEEVRTLSNAELRQRREHGQQLTKVIELIAEIPGEPSEGRLREARRLLADFRSQAPDSPYRTAAESFDSLLRMNGIRPSREWEEARRWRFPPRAVAPAIRLKDLDGKERTLDEFRGKRVLLVSFASWSSAAHSDAPLLQEHWRRLRERDVVIVGLNTAELDNPVQKARAFRDQHQLTFPILVDTDGKARKALRVRVLPTYIFIDEKGIVGYYGLRLGRDTVDRLLEPLYPMEE